MFDPPIAIGTLPPRLRACGCDAPAGSEVCRVTLAFACALTTGKVTTADEPLRIVESCTGVVALVESGIDAVTELGAGVGVGAGVDVGAVVDDGGENELPPPPPPPQATSVAASSVSPATPKCGFTEYLHRENRKSTVRNATVVATKSATQGKLFLRPVYRCRIRIYATLTYRSRPP